MLPRDSNVSNVIEIQTKIRKSRSIIKIRNKDYNDKKKPSSYLNKIVGR